MSLFITLSIMLPWIGALAIYLAKKDSVTNIVSFILLPILAFLGWQVFNSESLPYYMDTPKIVDFLIVIYDFGLLGYFLYQGVKSKNNLISIFAIVQLFLLIIVLLTVDHSNTANIYVDKVTAMFYLIVAIIGVPIAIFATKYMEYDEKGKHTFVAIVVWLSSAIQKCTSCAKLKCTIFLKKIICF